MILSGGGRQAKRNANVFPTPQLAERWRREMLEQALAEGRGSPETSIRKFPNRALADRFARQWVRRQ
jgi:hypothetical protein